MRSASAAHSRSSAARPCIICWTVASRLSSLFCLSANCTRHSLSLFNSFVRDRISGAILRISFVGTTFNPASILLHSCHPNEHAGRSFQQLRRFTAAADDHQHLFDHRHFRARGRLGCGRLWNAFSALYIASDEAFENRPHVEAFQRELGPEAIEQVLVGAKSGLLPSSPLYSHIRLLFPPPVAAASPFSRPRGRRQKANG